MVRKRSFLQNYMTNFRQIYHFLPLGSLTSFQT